MTGHNQYLRNKYSEILLKNLHAQKALENLSKDDIELIHSTLNSYFGSMIESKQIEKAMKKIIEIIQKKEGDN